MKKKRPLSFRLWLCIKKGKKMEQPYEARTETEQPVNESMKRKRNTEETEGNIGRGRKVS